MADRFGVRAVLECRLRGTSLIRNRDPPGPYIRTMPMALEGERFLMNEVPL